MYGIIYKALKQFVLSSGGVKVWDTITAGSPFVFNSELMEQPYSDDTIHYLAKKLAAYTGDPVEGILYGFGRYLIKFIQEQFPGVMGERGDTLKEYLLDLPNYHNRIMLIFPELTPPEFKVTAVTDKSLKLHYFTPTPGMREFMRGYLDELAVVYEENEPVEYMYTGNSARFEEVFKVSF